MIIYFIAKVASWFQFIFACTPIAVPPAFYGAIAATTGIIIQKYYDNMSFIVIFTIGMVAMLILTQLYNFSFHTKTVSLLMICLFFGTAWRYTTLYKHHRNFFAHTAGMSYTTVATIIDKKVHDHPYYKELYRMRVSALYHNNHQFDAPSFYPFEIFVYSTASPLVPGDIISLSSAQFKEPSSSSFLQYLMKEGIYATLFISSRQQKFIIRPPTSFYRWYHETYTTLHTALLKKINSQTAPYFSLLFLGEKTDTSSCFLFQKWGIAHYAARSGLHLTIFVFIWEFLLSIVPIPHFLKQLLLLLLCCAYAFLSKNATSFLRAFVIFLICKIYIMQKATTYFLHILSFVYCLFLLQNPFLLFCLDFQLSFALTYALVWTSFVRIPAR